MSDLSVQSKYRIEVRTVKTSLPVPKELQEELKGLGAKTVNRMRKEAVECPVKGRSVAFIECFLCDNFMRRIRGIVECRGNPLP